MTLMSSIAQSGMNAAQSSLDASAWNVANSDTPGSRRQQAVPVTAAAGAGVSVTLSQAAQAGPAMMTDVLGLSQALGAFMANLAVFKAADRMVGTLVDTSS